MSTIPDDIKAIAVAVLAHRLMLSNQSLHSGITKADIVREIIDSTKVPI